MSDKKQLIDQMNVVLSWELAGVVQYMHHGAMVMGPERETFFKFFKEGSEEARDHAQLVAGKIVVLGGVPTVEPARIRQGTTLSEMLHAALALEEEALAAWEAAHALAGAANPGTGFWMEEMIAHEQEHVDHLKMLTRGVAAASSKSGSGAEQAG